MKEIFNIFSKSKNENPVEKREIKKPKIIADYREKNSLVIPSLIELGADVEVTELKVADFIVNNIAVERKTISDFISSMINRRLFRQLEELQQYENKLLILEGYEEKEIYNDDNSQGVHSNAVRGFILSILIKHKIPILFTKDYSDTARFLIILAKKEEKESSLNVSKKSLDKKERMQFILESFPGIGPKTAKKLLSHFKTIKEVLDASQAELQEVIGKKAEIFRLIEEEY